jgi:hypothetical protein
VADAGVLLARISNWIDSGNRALGRSSEALTWGRLAKIAEEGGEVVAAFIGATGQNPRKGVTHTIEDVKRELLDVALTAVAAYEHLDDNQGRSLDALDVHIRHVAERAGLVDVDV